MGSIEYFLYLLTPTYTLSLFDFHTGALLTSWDLFPKTSKQLSPPLTFSQGIFGDWMVIHCPTNKISYFSHHSSFANVVKTSFLTGSSSFKIKDSLFWQKIASDESWTSMTMSNNCFFFLAGTNTGKLCIWRIKSGQLLVSLFIHYTSIEHMVLSKDDKLLCIITKDGILMGYDFDQIIGINQEQAFSENKAPLDHLLLFPIVNFSDSVNLIRISDVCIGHSLWHDSVLYIASLDSVKLYDCLNGNLLSSIKYQQPISKIILDPFETMIIAGSCSGDIYITLIDNHSSSSSPAYTLSAHNSEIISLSLLLSDLPILVSGDRLGHIISWDLANRVKLKEFKQSTSGLSFSKVVVKSPFLNLPPSTNILHSQISPFQWSLTLPEERLNVSCYIENDQKINPSFTDSNQNKILPQTPLIAEEYHRAIRLLFDVIHN